MTISLEEFPGRSREQRTSRRQQASKGKSAASLDRQRSKRRDNPNPNPSGAIATYLPKEIGEQQVDLGGEEEEVEVEVYVASGAAGEEEKEEVGGGLEEPKALDDGDDRKEKEEEVAASMQLLQVSECAGEDARIDRKGAEISEGLCAVDLLQGAHGGERPRSRRAMEQLA